jgi:hypothetical protein
MATRSSFDSRSSVATTPVRAAVLVDTATAAATAAGFDGDRDDYHR